MFKISENPSLLLRGGQRTIELFGLFRLPWPFPIAYWLRSSSAVVLGRAVYGSDAPRYIHWVHSLLLKISDAKYWVYYRLHPDHKYHIVVTGLEPGYYEPDTRLLHAAMKLLETYVDDCEQSGCHDPGEEALAILKWWKEERPADQAEEERLMHEVFGSPHNKMSFVKEGDTGFSRVVFPEFSAEDRAKHERMRFLEGKIAADEQKYLHRLIDIRQTMWT